MSELTPRAARQVADRVLIVPHCSECGDGLRRLLSLSGFEAEVVGGEAVRRALEVLPQAVLVDSDLPALAAGEVGRRLRAGSFSPGASLSSPKPSRQSKPSTGRGISGVRQHRDGSGVGRFGRFCRGEPGAASASWPGAGRPWTVWMVI